MVGAKSPACGAALICEGKQEWLHRSASSFLFKRRSFSGTDIQVDLDMYGGGGLLKSVLAVIGVGIARIIWVEIDCLPFDKVL